MTDRSRYRAYAAQCVQLASDTTDQKRKLLLLEMARHWLELAEAPILTTDESDPNASQP